MKALCLLAALLMSACASAPTRGFDRTLIGADQLGSGLGVLQTEAVKPPGATDKYPAPLSL